MQHEEKIKLLKSLRLLSHIPESQLASLAEFLRPKPLEDGAVVFEEGSWGMSLYFVSGGQIRITKKTTGGASRDLAILGPGEFFGETALVEEIPRTAGAIAAGPCVLLELFRGDMARWVKSNPQLAVKFFAELVQMQSQRLSRTSGELALFFDLFNLLVDRQTPPIEFFTQVFDRVIPSLEGEWSAAAYLGKAPAPDLGFVISKGPVQFEKNQPRPAGAQARNGWSDPLTYRAFLPELKEPRGCVIFRSKLPLSPEARVEKARTFSALSKFLATALEIMCSPG